MTQNFIVIKLSIDKEPNRKDIAKQTFESSILEKFVLMFFWLQTQQKHCDTII